MINVNSPRVEVGESFACCFSGWGFISRMFGKLGTFWIFEIVIEVFGFGFYFGYFFRVFIENMLANEIGTFEFFTTEGTEPFVFGEFLSVCLDELLNLAVEWKFILLITFFLIRSNSEVYLFSRQKYLRFSIFGSEFIEIVSSDGNHRS